MSSLVVFQHDLHGQYLPQSEEKLPFRNILSLKIKEEVDFTSRPLTRNRTKHMYRAQSLFLALGALVRPGVNS